MSKKKIAFCKRCNCYTEVKKLGKPMRTPEEKRDKIEEAVFTVGIWTALDFLCGEDKRPTLYKCTKCGEIFEL